MVTDILSFVKNLDKREVETQLALQCAPLLMRLKISNLFIVSAAQQERVKALFENTDFDILRLGICQEKVIFLVYQREQLWQYLNKPPIRAFLRGCGYFYEEIDEALALFHQSYDGYLRGKNVFPHEMGVLLGYPLEDVKAFIHNNGKNYLYAGYWKVYHNPEAALALFESYDRAVAFIMGLVTNGLSITNILNICTDKKNLTSMPPAGIQKYMAV